MLESTYCLTPSPSPFPLPALWPLPPQPHHARDSPAEMDLALEVFLTVVMECLNAQTLVTSKDVDVRTCVIHTRAQRYDPLAFIEAL